MLGEHSGANALLRRYVPGPGALAGGDEIVVWYEGAGTADKRWLLADERGSVVAVSDASGAALAVNRYDEWGIPATGNLGRFQYTGQAWLPELGLYSYKARMYSATLGRFMQTDPIGYGDGLNWYNYAHGDPVNGTDPGGDCVQFATSSDQNGNPTFPKCQGGTILIYYGDPAGLGPFWGQGLTDEEVTFWFGGRVGSAAPKPQSGPCKPNESVNRAMKEAVRRGDYAGRGDKLVGAYETFFWTGRSTPNGRLKIGTIRTMNSPRTSNPMVSEAIFGDGIIFDKTFYHYHPSGGGLSGSPDSYTGDIGAANGGILGLLPEFNIVSFDRSGRITGCHQPR